MNEPRSSITAGFLRDDGPAAARLAVSGEIDLTVAPAFREHLNELVGEARAPALVDLSAVTFMDSSGLAALAEAQQRADLLGAQLVLLDCSQPVRRVIEITGLDALLRLERGDEFEPRPG